MLTSGLSYILVANEVRFKVTLKVYHMLVPGLRFSQVHVDLVGPLPQSNIPQDCLKQSLSSLLQQKSVQ